MGSYSQIGQDKWVLSLFPEGYKGFFIDVGCGHPKNINNTYLLDKKGWHGFAFDIKDYYWKYKKWRKRTKFFWTDATNCDFRSINMPARIDYLSLDVDDLGANCKTIKNLINMGFQFGAITIEHNLYIGEHFNLQERIPQRAFLSIHGYELTCPDVSDEVNTFEDWWVDRKYIDGLGTRR